MNNYRKYIANLNYWAILLFVFWLPLKDNYFPIIISFWIFTWLLEGNLKAKFTSIPYKKLYIGFLFYFLLTIISLIHTKDIDAGLFDIQEKLSIAFFPIILAGSNYKIKNNFKTILLVFVLGNLVASIYCLSHAFFSNLLSDNGHWYIKYWVWSGMENNSFWKLINMRASTFSYSYLSVFKHPAYFAMFLTFSISILVYLNKKRIAKTIMHKVLIFTTMAFFVLMIYLLQSSAGFITFGLVALLSVIYEFKVRQKKRYIFAGGIFVLLGILAILFSKPAQKRIKDYTDVLLNPTRSELFEKDDRMGLWYSAVEVVKNNVFFGTAPANLSDELSIKYKKHHLKEAQKEKLNAHNQYLETWAGLGVLGLISLMYMLVYGFVIAYKKRHYLLFFLLVILSTNFMFESMLNRMAGILFMMFFYSLFVFMQNKPAKS